MVSDDPTTPESPSKEDIKQQVADFKASLSPEALKELDKQLAQEAKERKLKRNQERELKAREAAEKFVEGVDFKALREKYLRELKEDEWKKTQQHPPMTSTWEQDILDELESYFDPRMPWGASQEVAQAVFDHLCKEYDISIEDLKEVNIGGMKEFEPLEQSGAHKAGLGIGLMYDKNTDE